MEKEDFRPLSGVKVLDLSKVLAGPACAQALGDLGAEVIKVEPLGLGDETRGWPPFQQGLGTVFLSANRNKRSIAVNLKTEAGQRIVQGMAKGTDVVIESFGAGVAERLGVDNSMLRQSNDRLIYCCISGFGRSGPLRMAAGYDVILQAFCGVMAMTGDENSGFIRSPISPIDQITGVHALTGILAALIQRSRTGKGSLVNVSLYDSAMGLLGYNLQTFWARGTEPPKCGSAHESLCPYQVFEASDGPILIGIANDSLWARFCAVAGLEWMPGDARFRTNADRVRFRQETVAAVQRAIGSAPVTEWFDKLLAVGVPCSPINGLAELLRHPHTLASDIILNYEHSRAGAMKAIAIPVQFNEQPRSAGLPPPDLGEHTEEILTGVGFTAAEIAEFQQQGVIA